MLKRLNPVAYITPEVLHQALPLIILASIISAAGVASFILWRLRSRDPLLLWLGMFASLYGLRLFITNDLTVVARFPATVITYCIPIPLVLFLREFLGSGWKNSLVIWVWVEIAFAAIAIPADLLGYRNAAMNVNGFLIISGCLLLLVQLFFFYRAEFGAVIIRSGFVVFSVCVLVTNLGYYPIGQVLEPLGFLVLILALGSVAALRSISSERKLYAVEQELATARRIQSSTLPKSLPHMGGLTIATRYVPMTAVAGDFYDFLLIDESRMTILVADVSGHGVPAALVASMLKVGIAAQRHNAQDPAAVLAGLNGMLTGVLDGQFVTAACAFIDLAARTLTYSAAGHPPAVLARAATQDVVELTENGLMLGPFCNAAYKNLTVPFERRDKLLLYTDGIIEATLASGEPFGGEGLQEFMLRHLASAPSALADALILSVAGPVQEDDLTVVVAEAV